MALGKRKEKKGQAYAPCAITGCQNQGRVLARLGDMELVYCAEHRKKYGERVVNALINARFNYRLSNFLSVIKKDMFMNPHSHLCEHCREKEIEYIKSKTQELLELENFAEEHGITEVKNADKELDNLD